MGNEREQPFDSIESAQEFMALLRASVQDALEEVGTDREEAISAQDARRVDALDLAIYKLQRLDQHFEKSYRLLNDLRTIRRLLYRERSVAAS